MESQDRQQADIRQRLRRRREAHVAADLLVYTPTEMQWMIHTPLVRQVLEEGRALYEA